MDWSHDDLVMRGARWLTNSRGCFPVFKERGAFAINEFPDDIGWCSSGSILVECKRSLSDFYSDRQKPFRKEPVLGMGRLRYMLTPPGLIDPDRLAFPHGWGLLECHRKIIRVRRESLVHEYNAIAEIHFLRSCFTWGKIPDAA